MLELLTPQEMARADRKTIESGVCDGFSLMLAAGRGVADVALSIFGRSGRVAVLCGSGNNGGDGYVAAQYLLEAGVAVVCFALAPPQPGTDAMRASLFYKGDVFDLDQYAPGSFAGVIDALFGAGLARPVTGAAAHAIAASNAAKIAVVAVDLPSGISGEDGQVKGVAMEALATVTFFRKKPGHLLQPGRAHCGVLHVVDIGIPDHVLGDIRPRQFENGPDLWRLPCLAVNAHKYSRGHAAVFSGGAHATGAARLSAMAAARSGAGAVTLLSPPDAMEVNAAHLTSIMLRETRSVRDAEQFMRDRKVRSVVIGPGYGNAILARDHIAALLRHDAGADGLHGIVVDADGLTAFEPNPQLLFEARRGGAALVLTPHEGEFHRLFPDIAAEDIAKTEKARQAARRANAVVVYKGADTVIAAPDGMAVINSNGSPLLATAGSGDVLAGVIAGLLAQNMAAFDAACAAVWMHAEAARRFGPGLIAEDLPQQLPEVLQALARHD